MNLLAPLTFTDGEIGIFIRDNACALCRSHLVQYPAPGRVWTANCPEHGPVRAHNYTTKGAARVSAGNEQVALSEINVGNQPRQTPDEILKSMGF